MLLKDLQSKKVGITILGGGLRSTAYIGMLKAMEEVNLNIHALIGSSGGAVVAASYAFGNNTDKIFEHFQSFSPLRIFNPVTIITQGKLDYSSWENHAAKLVPLDKDIQDSEINLCIKSVDTDTRNSAYIDSGSAVKAVVASSAIFSSYAFNNHKYIDGDYDPETGVNKLNEMGADLTILAYVAQEKNSKLNNFIITQENALNSEIELHRPDIVLKLNISNASIFSKHNLRKNYDEGYDQTRRFLTNLK